jgi:molybdopterin synthase catalytic subunit
MRIRLLFFASYAEAFGRTEQVLDLPEGATVADCVNELRKDPRSARLPPSPLVAVNQRYVRLDQRLADGDEVALIPPVAGG